MPIKVLMPALSPTMEEGTLAKWTVKPGDQVNSGDVIAEIETDKATMEVEAVEEGRVGKLLVDEGTEGVQVNAPIAILLEEGEDDSALEAMTLKRMTPTPKPPRMTPRPGKKTRRNLSPSPNPMTRPTRRKSPRARPFLIPTSPKGPR